MRTAVARALLVPLLIAIPLVSGCQSEAKKHLYKAEDLFEKRDLDGAKKELEISIKLDDTSLDAHNSLAHIDEALGDQEGAAREYEKASSSIPPIRNCSKRPASTNSSRTSRIPRARRSTISRPARSSRGSAR